MKRHPSLALLPLLVILAAVAVWQGFKIAGLEGQLAEAKNELQRSRSTPHGPGAAPVADAPQPAGNTAPSPFQATKRSAAMPDQKAASDAKRAAFEQQQAGDRRAAAAAAAAANTPALTAERRKALMEGREIFNPGEITESKVPVTNQTPLRPGQALQVSYAGTWYAAEVVGFESDGGVHIKYFGWGPQWDEIVPRSDLRLDPQARERAVEKFGARSLPGG